MDLLAGYGSDASDGPEPSRQPPAKQGAPPSSLPSDFFQLAPAREASPAKPLAFGKLPAPKAVTKFRVPLHVAPVVSDDDDDAPAPAPKRPKTDGPTSISDFLPAPKNTTLGSSSSGARIEVDPDQPIAGPAPPPDDDDAIPYESNELYAVPANVDPDVYYAQLAAMQEPEPPQQAPPPPAGLGATDAALIEAALRVTEGGGRNGLKLADLKLVEMSQEQLTEMNAAERAEIELLSAALSDVSKGGPGAGISLEGGGGKGMHGGKAKSKHQISTLYATAKAREYNLLRNRGGVAYQSAQHKRETKAKYGW